MSKIFIVEDDENIREMTMYALKSARFDAFGFSCGKDFFRALKTDTPSIILLDIMLPEQDGLEILQALRKNVAFKEIPVIMLTAKTTEYDKVVALDGGADDYITKPFGVMELVSRVRALLRRTGKESDVLSICYKELLVEPLKHSVKVSGANIALTQKEFSLLLVLLQNKGIVLSRQRLLDSVWGFDAIGESRTVDVHIKTLRQKLGEGGKYIETVRGVGYKVHE